MNQLQHYEERVRSILAEKGPCSTSYLITELGKEEATPQQCAATLHARVRAAVATPGTWRIDIDEEGGIALVGLRDQPKPGDGSREDAASVLGLMFLPTGEGIGAWVPSSVLNRPVAVDKTCLSHWFPIIEAAGLPVPKTIIIRHPHSLYELLDGKTPPSFHLLTDAISNAAAAVGLPAFLRTGHTSGKHFWKDTCFLDSSRESVVQSHVQQLVEYSEMTSLMGLPLEVWAVREMLPVTPLYACEAYGGMPVVKEIRTFVDGGRVAYLNTYWPAEALAEGDPDKPDWKETYELDHDITDEDQKEVLFLAAKAGNAIGGRWSIDFLKTDKGWYLTDMAEAERSYGYNEKSYEGSLALFIQGEWDVRESADVAARSGERVAEDPPAQEG